MRVCDPEWLSELKNVLPFNKYPIIKGDIDWDAKVKAPFIEFILKRALEHLNGAVFDQKANPKVLLVILQTKKALTENNGALAAWSSAESAAWTTARVKSWSNAELAVRAAAFAARAAVETSNGTLAAAVKSSIKSATWLNAEEEKALYKEYTKYLIELLKGCTNG